ncbi:hypothetical protein CXB51_005253 [Gossypium anomalum]|uniref:Uncharacterized protein n=1 Tax=Gossypium anomalum TaxID=47600 RepID=A0A8J5YY75_9ROSI|nr:hypothetical protein CXB51_005253 [Gossypium anomalum]
MMLYELLPNFLFIEKKRVEVWCAILYRWSTTSHTVQTIWGEFTFTLEESYLKKKSEFKASFFTYLKVNMKEKVARFFNWIGVFHHKFNSRKDEDIFPEFPDHKYELEAFLIMWLTRLPSRLLKMLVLFHLIHVLPLLPLLANFSRIIIGPNYGMIRSKRNILQVLDIAKEFT